MTLTLAGLAMLGAFAIDTFLPSFPAIAASFSIDVALVQQTLSAYLLAFSVMSLFYGTLSDAFGRRPVILVSLVVFTVASAGAALAPSFGWLLFFRVLQGLSAGAGRVIGQAVVRDRFQGADAQRLMASITMVFGLAPAIAPVLGGYLHTAFGWRSVFVFLVVVGLLLLAGTWRYVPESLPAAQRIPFHPRSLLARYVDALRNVRFVAGALAVGFAFGGQAIYISAAPHFVLDILKLPETAFAWLFVPMIGGLVVGAGVGARQAARTPPARLLRIGFACMGVSAIANLVGNSLHAAALPWAVLPIMGYAFGLGLAMPLMSIATLDLYPAMRGLAASLITFMQMLVFSIMSGVVATLAFGSAARLAAIVLGGGQPHRTFTVNLESPYAATCLRPLPRPGQPAVPRFRGRRPAHAPAARHGQHYSARRPHHQGCRHGVGQRECRLRRSVTNPETRRVPAAACHRLGAGGTLRPPRRLSLRRQIHGPAAIANAMLANGYTSVPVDYRLSGEARFPAAVQDLFAAIEYVKEHGAALGIDPARIAVYGEPAGADLAALAGVAHNAPLFRQALHDPAADVCPRGVIALYPPVDFAQIDTMLAAQGCPAGPRHDDKSGMESRYLRAAVGSVPEQVRQSNPASYPKAAKAAPPPFFIENGSRDCALGSGQSALLAEALRDAVRAPTTASSRALAMAACRSKRPTTSPRSSGFCSA